MRVLSELSASPKKLHVHLLYCLLGIQLAYILIDHFAYHHNVMDDGSLLACVCNYPAAAMANAGHHDVRTTKLASASSCKTRQHFYDEDKGPEVRAVGLKGDLDPWHQMKWIGQPASCPVKGQLIEKLDVKSNFRRGYALKFVENVEDKTHLLPWLLGSKVNLNRRKRRVYIDLGANRFTTSIRWFLRMYPCDFTEIHAFEVNPRSWRPPKGTFDEAANYLAQTSNNSLLVKQKPGIPRWMMDRIRIHYKLASHEDDEGKGMVNITRFVKEELKLTKEDAVVVKMDIEGSEWPLLKAWMEDAEMADIVDELFVEAHYAHPSMSAFGWDSFSPVTREDAKKLLGELRWRGFYAHAWP